MGSVIDEDQKHLAELSARHGEKFIRFGVRGRNEEAARDMLTVWAADENLSVLTKVREIVEPLESGVRMEHWHVRISG